VLFGVFFPFQRNHIVLDSGSGPRTAVYPGSAALKMPSHAVHTHGLLKNVSVEAIYENNPVFADESVSVILRFKHLGQSNEEDGVDLGQNPAAPSAPSSSGSSEDARRSTGNGSEWFGKRLSTQLSNSARALFLDEFNKSQSKSAEDAFNKSIELFSGYVQVSGVFTFDEGVIDAEKFDQIHKKTTVSGKIGGLQGLELSRHQNDNLLTYISSGLSGFFSSDIQSMAKDGEESATQQLFESNKNLIPFFSTNQSLLFSSITLKAGEIKSFYYNCKLPNFLPPSYIGSSTKIDYTLIIGSSIDVNDGIPKPLVLKFPLRISPFFNKDGYQPIYDLNKFILLQSEKSFGESIERKASFKQLRKLIDTRVSTENLSLVDKREIFLKRIKDLQETDNNEDTIDNFTKSKVKDNISQFTELQTSTQTHTNESDSQQNDTTRTKQINGFQFERQITKFQNQYMINRNGKFISLLTFSRSFYKVGDSIRLHFNFQSPDATLESVKATGVMITLENSELIRNSFSVHDTQETTDKNTQSIIHYRESFSTFNVANFSVNVPIPINSTAQFKTNIFESKWSIVFKFILAQDDGDFTVKAFEDNTGVLQFAKDSLGGAEFNCRIPIAVIPSDQEFGGIPLKGSHF
jgi:hypothetical protein